MRNTVAAPAPARSTLTLLPLKLAAPPLREGLVPRPDLRALLAEVRVRPATLVIAPAGYGKTTLLAQWARELERTGAMVGWFTCDSGDREPATLLSYLVRAVQEALPGLGDQPWRVLNSVADLRRDWPLVAGELCAAMQQRLREPLFLFLDDLHTVAEAHLPTQIIGYILRAAPPTLHLVCASRRPLSFAPIPRLRAEDRLVEIGQRDLRLSPSDAQTILARQGVALAADDLNTLLARSDGWALSVQLASRALAAQPIEARSAFVQTLGGGQQQIFEYLASEVQADLPADLLDFLRLASLPAHFDAPLLSHVLRQPAAPSLLARAQALGLPISVLDDYGDRYRFHPLWRDLLLSAARELLGPDRLRDLHRRYGQAFEARGDLSAAIEHYVVSESPEDLARALRDGAWRLLGSPQRDAVRRWLELLPADVREQDAELLHMWGVSYLTIDPVSAAAKITRASELYRLAGNPQRELRALGDLAALLFSQARSDEFEQACRRAVDAANRSHDPWAPGAALVAAAALLYRRGRGAAALKVAARAARRPLNPFWQWLLAMITADVATRLGRPEDALLAVNETLKQPVIDQDDRLRLSLLRYRALALYQTGAADEAMAIAREVNRHLRDYYRDGAVGASAHTLALIQLDLRRIDEAQISISLARNLLSTLGDRAALAQVQALDVLVQALQGQAEVAALEADAAMRALDEAAGWLDHADRVMLAIIQGEGGREAAAEDLLADLLPRMAREGYSQPLALGRLYRAYLAERRGDHVRRRVELRAGWELLEADHHSFLPWLPPAALRAVATEAIRSAIGLQAVTRVLRRQLPDGAAPLLLELLNDEDAAVRARAATLLGDLGLATAYPALRAAARDRSSNVRQAAEHALTRLIYRPPYTLYVRTLGAFAVWRGEDEVRDREWRSVKARQLFQLLLTERGRMVSRERILDALWPELEAEAAANNLRVTISRLGKAIEPERPEGAPPYYVVQQSDTFGLNPSAQIVIDLDEFARDLEDGRRAAHDGRRGDAIATLRRAVARYGGTYLPDSLYEDWTVVERARLGLMFNEAALLLGNLLLADGLAHETVGIAWRVLEHDQAHEEAYRVLMRAHARLGERSTALRLFNRCTVALREELGVEPLPETLALAAQIREMPEEIFGSELS